jgi:hypothetical protein
VAAAAALHILLAELGRAGFEDLVLAVEGGLAVVAGAAEIPLHDVGRLDPGFTRLHGKADIHVAEPAAELTPVDPMLEDHRVETSLGRIIVNHHVPVLEREGTFLLDATLRKGDAGETEDYHRNNE